MDLYVINTLPSDLSLSLSLSLREDLAGDTEGRPVALFVPQSALWSSWRRTGATPSFRAIDAWIRNGRMAAWGREKL